MECPTCQFENMPGAVACTRCGAQLVVTGPTTPEDFVPPRAGGMKHLRPLTYLFHRLVDLLPVRMPEHLARVFRGDAVLSGESLVAMLLSACPGLGHVLDGRPKAALIAFGVWAVILTLLASFFYGTSRGVLLGMLMSWHAVVVFDAGRLQVHAKNFRVRLRLMLFILVVAGVTYFSLSGMADRYVHFLSSPYDIQAVGISGGDVLSVRLRVDEWRRGDVVAISRMSSGRIAIGSETYLDAGTYGVTIGRIVALSGDQVVVGPDGITVNGESVDMSALPEGNIPLPGNPVSFTLQKNEVLAVFPTRNIRYRGNADISTILWTRVYCMQIRDLYGRVTGVYLPLNHRKAVRGELQL
ncbi:hypothetical protein ACFL01_00795 [Planctomycetota bacterium]